jgi:hypothetical protein
VQEVMDASDLTFFVRMTLAVGLTPCCLPNAAIKSPTDERSYAASRVTMGADPTPLASERIIA